MSGIIQTGITLPGGPPAAGGSGFGALGPMMMIFGAINGMVGSYFGAKSQKSNLEFQADMAAINARMAETQAQSILRAGEKAQGQIGLRAGKVMGSQRASQAARGIVAGEGSAAEEIATTQLMKETDMLTINANAVQQAWAARMQGVNSSNQAPMANATASGISPFASAATSLISSGSQVAPQWYSYFKG